MNPLAKGPIKRGRTGSRSLNKVLAGNGGDLGAAPVNAVAAAHTTALAGSNNDLVFTADVKGLAGNSISVRYVNPGAETATETVTVSGNDITVNLRSVGGTLSTAAQVKAAIDANAAASALVSVANAGGNDGSGVVTALAKTNLSGGINGTPANAGTHYYHSGYMYYTHTQATINTATWVRVQYSTF